MEVKRGTVEVLYLCKYITSICTRDLNPISNLQLQKILYDIQKEYILRNQSALFKEDIEAWQFGPVVPVAYRMYSTYGAMPIIEINISYILEFEKEYKLKTDDIELINKIIVANRKKNILSIIDETHVRGGPWDRVYHSNNSCDREIPIEMIAKYS